MFLMKDLAKDFHVTEVGMAKLEEQNAKAERFTKVYHTVMRTSTATRPFLRRK